MSDKKEKNSLDKLILGAVIGAAIGSVIGASVAPEEGKKTREKLIEKAKSQGLLKRFLRFFIPKK